MTEAGRNGDAVNHSSCVHHSHCRFFTQVLLRTRRVPQVSWTNSAKAFDMTFALAVGARFDIRPLRLLPCNCPSITRTIVFFLSKILLVLKSSRTDVSLRQNRGPG